MSEEAEKEVERGAREARKENEAIRDLTKSEGWQILMRIADEQVKRRINQVMLTPLSEEWLSGHQEFTKGEAAGIRLFMKLPVDMLESEIESEKGAEDE